MTHERTPGVRPKRRAGRRNRRPRLLAKPELNKATTDVHVIAAQDCKYQRVSIAATNFAFNGRPEGIDAGCIALSFENRSALLDTREVHPGRRVRTHLEIAATAAGATTTRVDQVLAEQRRRIGVLLLGMRQRLGLAVALQGDPSARSLTSRLTGLTRAECAGCETCPGAPRNEGPSYSSPASSAPRSPSSRRHRDHRPRPPARLRRTQRVRRSRGDLPRHHLSGGGGMRQLILAGLRKLEPTRTVGTLTVSAFTQP